MSDIKDLLGKAVGDDEPPLGIDRDEVFRAGRQRVRRRRAFAAGGVVAAVVVAAVGAATLTNLISVEEPLPPAASDSRHAPPGPDLPLVTTKPPATSTAGPPLTESRAADLTAKLYSSGIVTRATTPDEPAFRVEQGQYLYEGDVTSPAGEGSLRLTVTRASPGSEATCADLAEHRTCEVRLRDGRRVAEATWGDDRGEKHNLAVVVLPTGTKVSAVASNFPRRYSDEGKQPGGGPPVLDHERLAELIVKSGFRAY